MVWFTSDTHFFHRNIIEHCKEVRGQFKLADGQYDIAGMNAALIANWNARVGKDDLVYHLGDFAWGNPGRYKGIREALNGRMFLIRGNHDPAPKKWLNPLDKWATSYTVGDVFLRHVPPGDDHVYGRELVVDPIPEGTKTIICGHVHAHWKEKVINGYRCINVGVDVNALRPIALNEVGFDPETLLRVHKKLNKEE